MGLKNKTNFSPDSPKKSGCLNCITKTAEGNLTEPCGIMLYYEGTLHCVTCPAISLQRSETLFLLEKRTGKLSVFAILILFLPLIGAVSSRYGDRQLLLAVFLIAALSVYFVLCPRSGGAPGSNDRFFTIIIFSVSLSLLLSQSLASDNLIGWDIHSEYNVFSQVSREGAWRPNAYIQYNSVLSVSILPVILNIVSALNGITIFKFIFPLIYSMAPVLLYRLCRRILQPEASFLAVFLFMAYQSFYVELIALARQEVAEILLLLSLLLLFSPRIQGGPRLVLIRILILILTLGIVTAHYSIAYLYLFLLMSSFLLSRVFPKKIPELVNLPMLALAGTATVTWYAFIAGGLDFGTLVRFISNISLADLFDPQARPTIVSRFFGFGVLPGLLHVLNRITYYLVNLAIILGFFVFILKRQKSGAERRMIPLMTSGMLLLGSAVVIPQFAFGLNFTRLYHIALLFVSPCFVYGSDALSSTSSRLISVVPQVFSRVSLLLQSKRVLPATILFLFLLFDSGWVWAVSMDRPTSILLDRDRMLSYPDPSLRTSFFSYYTAPEDIAAALWLRPQLANIRSACADYFSRDQVLTSYGQIRSYSGSVFSYLPRQCDFHGYVYLSTLNTIYGIGTRSNYLNSTWSVSEISAELFSDNVIYSNGGAKIYVYPG